MRAASNIKTKINQKSVITALKCAQEKLKHYKRTPPNGLILYTGEVLLNQLLSNNSNNNKLKKISIAFEPWLPIKEKLYICDNKFYVKPLETLLESSNNTDITGFIIINGDGCIFAKLTGNYGVTILTKFNENLPNKHKKGGQSQKRYERLRKETRAGYVKKCAETAKQVFINSNGLCNINNLILGGCAGLKHELFKYKLFEDCGLSKIVIKIIDTSYGGDNGLNQCINESKDCLKNLKYLKEKDVLLKYFKEISKGNDKYCFGIKDTMIALEMGAVDKLIVYDSLQLNRVVLGKLGVGSGNEEKVIYVKEGEWDEKVLKEIEMGELNDDNGDNDRDDCKWEVKSKEDFLEWLVECHKSNFGCDLEMISDYCPESNQFIKGFEGIGGLLRWKINFVELDDYNYQNGQNNENGLMGNDDDGNNYGHNGDFDEDNDDLWF